MDIKATEGQELAQAVYYSLLGIGDGGTGFSAELTCRRTAHLVSLLCQRLVENGAIARQDITALVAEAVR